MKDIDKYRGCLIGGAVGDALGYAVEFSNAGSIFQKYGAQGITEYELLNGIAPISDDTQMTLFTANGLLLGTTRGMMRGIMGAYPSYIAMCYRDWLKTQCVTVSRERPTMSWLNNIPEMNHCRAPGSTCLQALHNDVLGSVENPINDSKGCGGVMRVAPIGLYFEGKRYTPDEIDMIAAETAALTHGHELGYIPAAMLAHIIHILSHSGNATVSEAVSDAKAAMCHLFPHAIHLQELVELIEKAEKLAADTTLENLNAIRRIGEGWVAEETLALALYCALKYENDFEKAIIAAVNHSGDSDSVGSVTGNILGARLGLKAIPEKFLHNLELKDTILEIADDLFNDCQMSEYDSYHDAKWEQKYIYHTYPNNDDTPKTTPHKDRF